MHDLITGVSDRAERLVDEGAPPFAQVKPWEVEIYVTDLDGAIERLVRFRRRLARQRLRRKCAHCGRIMPKSRAPQARYCGRSCRQRAYENRSTS